MFHWFLLVTIMVAFNAAFGAQPEAAAAIGGWNISLRVAIAYLVVADFANQRHGGTPLGLPLQRAGFKNWRRPGR
jgi:hypothetical protein